MIKSYKGEGISLTRSARPMYLLISLLTISGLFMYSHGWSTITKWFVGVTIVVLIFCIWFPYSPFVKIELHITDDKVYIGKYLYTVKDIVKIINQREGIIIEFHMEHLNEPISVRMDEGFQKDSSDYLQMWANFHNISYETKI